MLPYTNGFFGFAVVPRLHYADLVRYHRLRYAPHGDLKTMPYEVGDFLVHQAKASGHFLRPFLPERLHDAFFDCVRPLYDKLLRSFERKGIRALTQDGRDQDLDAIMERARREMEDAFREAYDRYDFYQHPPGGQQTTITAGVLGWRRREDIVQLAAEMGIDCELARTPFAAYARGHLQRVIVKLRRESLEKQDDRDGKEQDKKARKRTGLVIQDPTGRYYYTINKLARTVKRSASYLRDLDDLLEPVRVSDVFGDRRMGRHGLPGNTRLYPADAESLKRYETLLTARHPRLDAEDLRTEAQVADWLGVSVWWLRNRREGRELEAGREGRFVVYNADQRAAARRLRDRECGC